MVEIKLIKIHRVISNLRAQIFPGTPGRLIVFAESTRRWVARGSQRARSLMMRLLTQVMSPIWTPPLSNINLALIDPEEARAVELDKQVIDDDPSLPPFVDDDPSSDDEEDAPPVRRSSRLDRIGSA